MKLNCIIVDDEEGAQYILQDYLSKLDYVQLSGTFYNVAEALAFLQTNKADILLLDINMPGKDGFALLDELPHRPVTIFTTAYSHHALKGFEYGAVDYLYKPIHFDRFTAAMDKARKWCSLQQVPQEKAQIQVRADGRMLSVKTADICYAESLGNYIKIHTLKGSHMVLMTLSELESLLPVSQFVRVHKSYLVNAACIHIAPDGELHVNDVKIPVGNTYKKYFTVFMKGKDVG